LKSGSLNLLQPSGPVQAWNGIALLFTSTMQFERTIYTVMENFQTHSLLAKKKIVMSELKINWTIQALKCKQDP